MKRKYAFQFFRCASMWIAAPAVCFCLVSSHAVESYTFLLTWGSRGFGRGKFDRPNGMAVDSSGSVFGADTNNNRTQKFVAEFAIKRIWGPTNSPTID